MATKSLSRESQLSINQYVPAAAASRSSLVSGAAPFLYKTASIKALPPMILQKTGWRIKQLISHRRSRTFDDGERSTADKERRLGGKLSRRPSKRRSWIGNSKTSIDVPFLENGSDGGQQQTDISSHSSTSSLSSFSCDTNDDDPLSPSLFCEPRSPEILYLEPSSNLGGDAQRWRLIFPEEKSASSRPSKSTFDLLEALALGPTDNEKTPTPTIKNARKSSENHKEFEAHEGVKQLIRETDEAFKPISTILEQSEPDPKPLLETNEVANEESKPQERDLERRFLKKQKKAPTTRLNSISKAKRTKSTKKKARLLDLAAAGSATPPVVSSPPLSQRWTLVDVTDNISDIFSGTRRIFRTEVDEMIDTTKIGRISNSRAATPIKETKRDNERKGSIDTMSSHGADELPGTPNDPFELESLSSRLGASGIVSNSPDPKSSPSSSTTSPPIIPLKSELRNSKRDSAIHIGNSMGTQAHSTSKDINMPSSPSPRQRSRSYPRQPSLPTIQEVSPLSPRSKSGLRKPHSVPALPVSSPDNLVSPNTPSTSHILLNSTPFTLTSPNFQHGSIRLPRGQKRNFKSSISPLSETPEPVPENEIDKRGDQGLDWTAFEMAISGGTGNYLMGGAIEADEIEGNPEEIEEIVQWWEEFGFEGVGRLVDGVSVLKHKRKKSKLNSEDVGISYELDGSAVGGKGVGDVVVGENSLPPSPVDDLRVLETHFEGLPEVVPMGFNLSHDLDDYLKWESAQTEGMEE